MQVYKRCSYNNCKEYVDARTGRYCKDHEGIVDREYNQYRKETQKAYVDFYRSYRWQKVRMQSLRRHKFLCLYCLKDGIYTTADEVHHEIPTKTPEGWKKRFDIEHLSPICRPCHNRIEKEKRY